MDYEMGELLIELEHLRAELAECKRERDADFNKLREDRKHVRYLLTLAYAKLYNAQFSLKDPSLMNQIEKYLQNTGD